MKIDLSLVRTEDPAISGGFSAPNSGGCKTAQYALRTCCTDHVFQSIYDRHSFIHEFREVLDEEDRPCILAQGVDLNRQLNLARMGPGEDSM